jgi:DNA-binding XRE family transcriptional regulator
MRPVPNGQRWILRHALGDEIYSLRMLTGFGKRHWLAQEIKISIPTVAAMEKGRPTEHATVNVLKKMAQAFSLQLSIEIDGEQIFPDEAVQLEELIIAGAQVTFVRQPTPTTSS